MNINLLFKNVVFYLIEMKIGGQRIFYIKILCMIFNNRIFLYSVVAVCIFLYSVVVFLCIILFFPQNWILIVLFLMITLITITMAKV